MNTTLKAKEVSEMEVTLSILYMVAFWSSLLFVYHDAKRRDQPMPFVQLLGVALIAPIGILIYLGTRD